MYRLIFFAMLIYYFWFSEVSSADLAIIGRLAVYFSCLELVHGIDYREDEGIVYFPVQNPTNSQSNLLEFFFFCKSEALVGHPCLCNIAKYSV